jgi:hypothetical protein
VVDLKLETYDWKISELDDLLAYIEQVFDFVNDFPSMMKGFFSLIYNE